MAHLRCAPHKKRVVVVDVNGSNTAIHRATHDVCPGDPTCIIGSQGLSASVIQKVRMLRSVKDGK